MWAGPTTLPKNLFVWRWPRWMVKSGLVRYLFMLKTAEGFENKLKQVVYKIQQKNCSEGSNEKLFRGNPQYRQIESINNNLNNSDCLILQFADESFRAHWVFLWKIPTVQHKDNHAQMSLFVVLLSVWDLANNRKKKRRQERSVPVYMEAHQEWSGKCSRKKMPWFKIMQEKYKWM